MKHQDLIRKLTLLEKAVLLSGKTVWETRDIKRLGIPSIFLADGPHGLRKQAGAADHLGLNPSQPATCFPTAATVANSWNPALGEQLGAAIGAEAVQSGVDVVLGPGMNIKRSPLCGRNFEYFSEDPYLAGKMAAGYIRGIQSVGVCACPKHFAANNQELCRMVSDSIIDERTLRELYLTAFEIAVKEASPATIMSSYNRVNGDYANENAHLLQDILREEWGFNGLVITDWGGSNDIVEGVRSGCGLEMPAPGFDSARQLVAAVNSGSLSEAVLDARVDEVLRVVLASCNKNKEHKVDFTKHHDFARHIAEESIVLLKNESNILPLAVGTKVAVIGDFAKTPRYQGAGSSMVNPVQVETVLDCMASTGLNVVGFSAGFQRDGTPDPRLQAEALQLAEAADTVLLFLGLDEISEIEGLDRSHMKIHANQSSLLEAISKVNTRIVVVLNAGSVVELPWKDKCMAIVHGYLGGQAGASAILNVITGKVNPSGKLAETYPIHCEDTPTFGYFPDCNRTIAYKEGLYVGYRYYTTASIPTAFPFGFGLSYTSFSYRNLHVSPAGASFTITNTGKRAGAEIAQLYIGCKDGKVFRPSRELKGFVKIILEAGESREVTIPFDDKSFRYYNVHTRAWEVETAEYVVMVGASCEDIRLQALLPIEGTVAHCPYDPNKLPAYYSGQIRSVTEEQFNCLLGNTYHPLNNNELLGRNDTVSQMKYTRNPLARLVCRIILYIKERNEKKGRPNLNILFIYFMPFRAIAKMTNGAVSMEMVDGLVTLINGKFWKGLRAIVGGYFRNKKANQETQSELDNFQHTGDVPSDEANL